MAAREDGTSGLGRRMQPHHYSDPETGAEDTLWDVMAPSPTSVKDTWGDYYRIARYSDRAAAEEHARTGRKPHGYG